MLREDLRAEAMRIRGSDAWATASASTNTRFGLLLVFIHRHTIHHTPLFS